MSDSQQPGTPYPPQGQPHPPAPQPGQPYSQPGQPYSQPGQPYSQPGQPYSQPGQPYSQPGQPYSQPGQPYSQPGQPYSQPGQPYGAPYATQAPAGTAPTRPGNPVARTAFLVTVLSVGVGLISHLLLQILHASALIGWDTLGEVPGILNFVVFVGAVAGLVLGIAALRRPAPHLLAAIAIGVAANTVAGTLASAMSSVFYNFGF